MSARRAIYENLRDLQFEYRLANFPTTIIRGPRKTAERTGRRIGGDRQSAESTGGRDGSKRAAPEAAKPKPDGKTCPGLRAKFPQALKFCGECGKAMA